MIKYVCDKCGSSSPNTISKVSIGGTSGWPGEFGSPGKPENTPFINQKPALIDTKILPAFTGHLCETCLINFVARLKTCLDECTKNDAAG